MSVSSGNESEHAKEAANEDIIEPHLGARNSRNASGQNIGHFHYYHCPTKEGQFRNALLSVRECVYACPKFLCISGTKFA